MAIFRERARARARARINDKKFGHGLANGLVHECNGVVCLQY
jgi:hypothetical protein